VSDVSECGGDRFTALLEDEMLQRALGTLVAVCLFAAPAFAQGRIPADAINLNGVVVYNSPKDVASWPVTTAITQLTMRSNADPYYRGISLNFSARSTWPDYTPPGWDGPLQYTVWVVWYAAGQWNAAGIIQMWRDRASTGAPLLEYDPGCSVNNFACNWVYSSRWGPGYGHQAFAGETMYFFVTPGNARDTTTVTSLRERSNVVAVTLPANDVGDFSYPATVPIHSAMDIDGDGRSEIAVFRPSNGAWLGLFSTSNFTQGGSVQWGVSGDIPVPGDYDGDGLTDPAVYRPSTGYWLIANTSTRFGTSSTYHWGAGDDIPVPGDYDGDGKTDPAVYRRSSGYWMILKSSANYQPTYIQWGAPGDTPVPADYDGDGKTDPAVYRSSNGFWLMLKSSQNYQWTYTQWGLPGDIPMPGDYDGDGKSDPAVYRPSNGYWFLLKSGSNYQQTYIQWGVSGDVPIVGDYDGDGKMDIGVYRPSSGYWLIKTSSTNFNSWMYALWGLSGDSPLFQSR